jgi:hypothetical protein
MESNHRFLDVNQASSPLDHGIVQVAEVGVEPTKSRGSRPRRFAKFAYPAVFQLQAPVSNRAHGPYESQLGTGRACNE